MKSSFTLCIGSLLLMASGTSALAQSVERESEGGRNMVKLNMLPLVSGKFAFEYERLLKDRISVGASLSFETN